MALTPVLLIPIAQLPNAVASQGGPTAPAHWLIKRLVIINTDSASQAVTIYNVTSAGSPSAANQVLPAFVLAPSGNPGATYVVSELTDKILNPGDTIQAFATTAAKVNIIASGFVY